MNRQTTDTYTPHPLTRHVREAARRLGFSEGATFTLTAVLVGVLTGLGSLLFLWLIVQLEAFSRWGYDLLEATFPLGMALIPALGGLFVGLLITYVAPEVKAGGIPEVLQAIALHGSRIRPRVALVKPLATAFCIASGGSAGRVGPIVQIGSALGSLVGQLFHLTDERIRNLVACGAAAGIASTFNAPIAGVIFALEVILGEFTETYFATIVISAVTSSVVSQHVLGTAPAFRVPTYEVQQPLEMLGYLALGGLASLVAWLFTTTLYATRDLSAGFKRLPDFLKPALGGLLLGLLGLLAPQILGIGFEGIEDALYGRLSLQALVLLLLLKLVATNLTLGSGSSGGVFAPALFMGAMLGGTCGEMLRLVFPHAALSPVGAYALVGMAAVFAAAAHAPMTAMLIVFEMSGSYSLILPLMLATTVSTVIARALRRESIYTLTLARRGVRTARGQDMDVLQSVRVDEIMARETVTVQKGMPLAQLATLVAATHHHGYPVLDEGGQLAGVVALSDLSSAQGRWDDWATHTIGEICTCEVFIAHPDESVAVVLQRMGVHDLGSLPVVTRWHPHRLVGLIQRSDIGRAYQRAIARRRERQYAGQKLRLESLTGTAVVELVVAPASPVVGRAIRDCPWPEDCLIVSVQRGDQILVGKGDTVIQRGDRLTVYANETGLPTLRRLLAG